MSDKRQKTLMLSVFFSSFGPIITFIALMMNTSATQFADFFRRTVELTVLILALYIYVKTKNHRTSKAKKLQYKRWIYLISALVLSLSGLLILVLSIHTILVPSLPEGNIYLGLAIALLGVLFNGYFWWRYLRFNQEKQSAIMDTQGKIYQAKTFVDVNVVIALLSVQVFQGLWASYWIDVIGSFMIAFYLIFRSLQFFTKAKNLKNNNANTPLSNL